jgi:hypothetical protein
MPDKQDNFEEPNEEDDLDGLPTGRETLDWALGVAMDLENNLQEDEDPFDVLLNVNINAGQLMNLCWFFIDLYAEAENLTEEDITDIQAFVKAKKLVPPSKDYIH